MEVFSIREYALRMRSIDVVKCWPFDETTCEETVKSLLPPITIKKFTWWIDELQYLHPDSAQNDLRNSKNKKKVKSLKTPPKKRSIVEIFAVAPQLERVSTSNSSDDKNEDVGSSSKWGEKGKKNWNNKKNNKEILLSNLKKPKKIIKKINKNKETPLKMKRQYQDKAIQTPTPSCSKESEKNDICDDLSICKRKSGLICLDEDKSTMTCKMSELISDNENPRLNACGILKNRAEDISLKQSIQCSENNVTFLEKDRIEDISNRIENENVFEADDPRFPPVFKDYLKTYNEPSVSDMSNFEKRANKMHQGSSESNDIGNSSYFQYRTSPYISSEELPHGLWSLPNGNLSGNVIISTSDKDFVGLPLNSRGELMSLNSRTAISEGFGTRSEHVSWDSRTFLNDQVFIPSRSDIQSNDITDLDFNLLKMNDDLFHFKNFVAKEEKKIPENHGNEKIQATIRLMGKEVTVGGRDFHGFEDGLIWKDKQIIDDIHYQPYSGKSGDTLSFPSESLCSLMHQNGFSMKRIDNPEKLYSTVPLNSNYLFPQPVASPFKSHQNYPHPNASSSVFQLKNEQNFPQFPISAIRFPFMNPDLEQHVQSSSWNRNNYVIHPPLAFDGSEKGIPMRDFLSHCSLGSSYKPEVYYEHVGPASTIMLTQYGYNGLVPVSVVQNRRGNQNNRIIGSRVRRNDKKVKRHQHPAGVSNFPFNLPSSGFPI